MSNIQIDPFQTTLHDFFSLPSQRNWSQEIGYIIRRLKMDIWNIDISKLIEEYKKTYAGKDLDDYMTGLLICSMLLKSKSRRIGLNEIKERIDDELEDENEEKIETIEVQDSSQMTLEDFAKKLAFMDKEKKVSVKREKKIHTIKINISTEDYKTTSNKLLEYILNKNGSISYKTLIKSYKSENNIFMALLYMHSDDKVDLTQENQYDDFNILAL